MAHRLYFGNLDPSISQQELEDECKRFGKVTSVWVARNPPGFAFVEYEDLRDAEDCVNSLNDNRLGQQRVKVQFARNKGKNAAPAGGGKGGADAGGGSFKTTGGNAHKHRAILKNLPATFSWKELKDEMRRIGDVIYADVDQQGDGVVEFATVDDLEYAVRKLDGSRLDGNIVTVYKENAGGGQPPGRGNDDDRRRDDDRRGGDRRDGSQRDDLRDRDERRDERRYDDDRRDDRRYDRRYDASPPRDNRRYVDDDRRGDRRDDRRYDDRSRGRD